MKVHVRSFDGRFYVYLYAGPVRLTLWRSNLFHRRGLGIIGVVFDLAVLAALFGAGVWLAWTFGPAVLAWWAKR